MWHKVVIGTIFFVLCAVLQACGDSAVHETPARLFEEPTLDLSAEPQSQDVLSGVLSAIGSTGSRAVSSFQSRKAVAGSASRVASKIINLAENDDGTGNCTVIGDNLIQCSMKLVDADGTHLKYEATFRILQKQAGRIVGKSYYQIQFVFHTYEDSCGQLVQVDGHAQCDLDFDIAVVEEEVAYSFGGSCNTGNDLDNLLDVVIDNVVHRVGLDLDVALDNSAEYFSGIVAVDGTTYRLSGLDDLVTTQCE